MKTHRHIFSVSLIQCHVTLMGYSLTSHIVMPCMQSSYSDMTPNFQPKRIKDTSAVLSHQITTKMDTLGGIHKPVSVIELTLAVEGVWHWDMTFGT